MHSHTAVVIKRDGNKCHYCEKPFGQKKGHVWPPTREHIVPRAFGGINSVENYVAACGQCNNRRGTQLFYCQCERCTSLINAALMSDSVVNMIFDGIVRHNRAKIYKVKSHHGKPWVLSISHHRKHYKTFEGAVEAWKNYNPKPGAKRLTDTEK